LGGERKVDVAREFGYRDCSGVTQLVKRLEQTAKNDRSLGVKLRKLSEDLSNVKS